MSYDVGDGFGVRRWIEEGGWEAHGEVCLPVAGKSTRKTLSEENIGEGKGSVSTNETNVVAGASVGGKCNRNGSWVL